MSVLVYVCLVACLSVTDMTSCNLCKGSKFTQQGGKEKEIGIPESIRCYFRGCSEVGTLPKKQELLTICEMSWQAFGQKERITSLL